MTDKLFWVTWVFAALVGLAWCSFLGWLAYMLLEWLITK